MWGGSVFDRCIISKEFFNKFRVSLEKSAQETPGAAVVGCVPIGEFISRVWKRMYPEATAVTVLAPVSHARLAADRALTDGEGRPPRHRHRGGHRQPEDRHDQPWLAK